MWDTFKNSILYLAVYQANLALYKQFSVYCELYYLFSYQSQANPFLLQHFKLVTDAQLFYHIAEHVHVW